MPGELIIIYLILGFVFAMFCSSLAREKGHSESTWALIGFFFSFIALIVIAGMPDLISRNYLRRLAEALPTVQP
jgi:cell division protein FtsW (lipid II flippase)